MAASTEITGDGEHVIGWRYKKNNVVSEGGGRRLGGKLQLGESLNGHADDGSA